MRTVSGVKAEHPAAQMTPLKSVIPPDHSDRMDRTNVPQDAIGADGVGSAAAVAAAAKVAAWVPDATVGHDSTAEAVFVRVAVGAAGPRNVKEAGKVLRWCYQYACWRTTAGRPLDAATAFNPDDIAKFVTAEYGQAPVGSQAAVRSHLNRLAPGVGLAGTTRKGASTHQPVRIEQATPIVSVPARIEEAIDSYAPERVDPERWAAVRDVVREAVRSAQPGTVKRGEDLMRHGAYLAAWSSQQDRPVRVDTIFATDTIEAFIAVVDAAWEPGSVRTVAANLHHLRQAAGQPLDVERRTFSRDSPKSPYSSGEIARLYAQAGCVPSAKRRRHVTAGLDLVLGAGISGAAAGSVRPSDLATVDGRLFVTLNNADAGPGKLRVLDRYAESLETLQREAADQGEEYMLGGTVLRRDHRFFNVMNPAGERFGVPIDMTRARLSWTYEVGHAVCAQLGSTFALRALLRTPSIVDLLDQELQ